MRIDAVLCRPNECALECIQACQRIHGDNVYIKFDEGDGHPHFENQPCTSCLSCARACPFDAISLDEKRGARRQAKRRARVKIEEDKRPYEVADYFERFPEANMIFARVYKDPSFQHYQKGVYHSSESVVRKRIAGYGRLDLELSIATWKLYDSRFNASDAYDVKQHKSKRPQRRLKADPEILTQHIKRVARFFGASLVGVAKLDRKWIYQTNIEGEPYDIDESIMFAVVMAVEMDYDKINSSPAFAASVATALGYSKMAFLEIELAEYI